MIRIAPLALAFLLTLLCGAAAAERIKRKPPTPADAERIASETVINDSLLQKGDIISTDHGFFLYRGLAADGVSGDFVAVANPSAASRGSSPAR
jgi:hypothetical protein